MKISIDNPTILGNPQISQNRQYQNYSNKTRIYPVQLGYMATVLRDQGNEVTFFPGKYVGEDITYWEVKTPVYNQAVELAKSWPCKVEIIGDHVNYDPLKSYRYDELPLLDRKLTDWKRWAYNNGNYSRTPGTYTQFSRDCWWGKCTFCSWASYYNKCETMSVNHAIEEVENCVKIGAKEIFDDSGTFPKGEWLHEFCKRVIKEKYPIRFGCNMRFGACGKEEFTLLHRAGFRYILFGLESTNQATLNRINKGIKFEDVQQNLRDAKSAGLKPHVTFMVGYPWESREDVERTVSIARDWFREGLIDSLQATIVIPYPNTPLWKEAKEAGLLLTERWEDYDMQQPVLRTDYDPREYVKKLYRACLTPKFVLRNCFNFKKAWYWRGHI